MIQTTHPLIVAEIGANHCGELTLALEHIEAAAEAGADIVKFQSLDVSRQYYNAEKKILDLHKKIDLQKEWLEVLNDAATSRGIEFMSAPTYLEAVDDLEKINVKRYKIASAQLPLFPQLIKKIARTNKPTLASIGISTISEILEVRDAFFREGGRDLTIMHCNSIYPVEAERVNLRRIPMLKEVLRVPIGFSDHSIGIHLAIAAVGLGAIAIEKHLATSKQLPSPDAVVSITPDKLKELIGHCREVAISLGSHSRDVLEPEEKALRHNFAYKIVLKCDVQMGQLINENHFVYLRSKGGIDCRTEAKIIGIRRYRDNYLKGQLLTKTMID